MSFGINSAYENDQQVWNVGLSGELDLSCSEELKMELNNNIESVSYTHLTLPTTERV